MATPTFLTDLVTWSDADSETGWTEIGGAMLALDEDNFIQGAAAIGVPMRSAGLDGVYYTSGATTDLTDKHIFAWVHINAASYLSHSSGGGARIYVGDGTNGGYWYIGGSDSDWAGRGWRCCVVDCNKAFDANTGTDPALSAIDEIGVAVSALATPGKANLLIVDAIRVGSPGQLEVTSGTSGDPVTFQDIVDYDFSTSGDALGFVSKNPAGTYEIAGRLIIGDIAGADDTYFYSVGEQVAFLDSPVADDFYAICGIQSAGSTQIVLGIEAVSGENAVGYGGTTFYSVNDDFNKGYLIDFSYDISGLDVNGCVFVNADTGLTFTSGTHGASAHVVASTTFTECGQVSAGKVKFRNSIFSNTTHSGTSGAALLWNDDINVSACSFLANVASAGSASHAIQHTTSGSYDYYGLTFAGNDYDIWYTAAANTLTINSYAGSNPTLTATTGTGDIEIINSVVLRVYGVETTTEPTNYVRAYMETLSGGPEATGVALLCGYASGADGDGTYQATSGYNFSSDQPVVVRTRYAGYLPYVISANITSAGLAIKPIWIVDTNYTP